MENENNKELCERCGKEQSAGAYCIKWKDDECIRMQAVIPV